MLLVACACACGARTALDATDEVSGGGGGPAAEPVPDGGSSAGPSPAPAPACLLGEAPITGSSCDNQGVCGGVSLAEGCVNCAMNAECGDHYFAANLDQDEWAAWNQCHAACSLSGSDPSCCYGQCNQQFPDVGERMTAFFLCVYCTYCPNDCGANTGYPGYECVE
jgi:hypothetical protein